MFPRGIFVVVLLFVIVTDAQRPLGTFLTNFGDIFGYDVFRRPRIVIALPPSIQLAPVAPAPAPPASGSAAPAPAAPAAAPAAPASASLVTGPFGNWIVG